MLKKLLLTLRLGFFSLLLHKLRAVLAVLGILIGVTAVIWLVALGEGISVQAQKQIEDLGARNIIVRTVKPAAETGENAGMWVIYGLTRADFDRIRRAVPQGVLVRAVPMREFGMEAVSLEDGRTANVKLVGCTPEYKELNHLRIDRGRFLTRRDAEAIDNVVVLGSKTANELFPGQNPIGKRLIVFREIYTVVGQMKSRLPSAAIGGSLDARDYKLDVYIPIQTWDRYIGDGNASFGTSDQTREVVERNQFTLTVNHIDQVEAVERDMIQPLLAAHHPLKDYAVIVPKELLRQAEMLRMMFNVLLVIIASISLLVGGIGIMNIMLATVTERTREIGIRRALGATQGDIVLQFLIESLVLTGVGGVLGVLLGLAVSPVVGSVRWILQNAFPNLAAVIPANILELQPIPNTGSIIVAFLIAVSVGLLFGLYPAYRASKMDPIEALRHE